LSFHCWAKRDVNGNKRMISFNVDFISVYFITN
jgi:hypothetical protein